jgi:hypothetical protein
MIYMLIHMCEIAACTEHLLFWHEATLIRVILLRSRNNLYLFYNKLYSQIIHSRTNNLNRLETSWSSSLNLDHHHYVADCWWFSVTETASRTQKAAIDQFILHFVAGYFFGEIYYLQ